MLKSATGTVARKLASELERPPRSHVVETCGRRPWLQGGQRRSIRVSNFCHEQPRIHIPQKLFGFDVWESGERAADVAYFAGCPPTLENAI